jgi:hypothetical protein
MDQIEGGTLMVNRAKSVDKAESANEKKDEAEAEEEERNLGSVEGLEHGWNLAQVSLRPKCSRP